MIFTVTERSVYKRCRRKWNYQSSNRMNIQPIIDAPALTLGLVMHKALEQWFLHPDMDLEELTRANAALSLQKTAEAYKEKVGVDVSVVELAECKQAIIVGLGMATNYQDYYKDPVPEGFKLISPEQRIVIDVPGSSHKLEGRVDALLEEVSTGKVFVMDHKTYEKRFSYHEIANNDQFLAYTWIAQRAFNRPIAGYIFNGLWKRAVPGKNHSFADLFHRQLVERPQYELENFGTQLAAELDEMGSFFGASGEKLNSPLIFPNRRWEGCWDCKQFSELCEAQSKDPIKYELLLKHSYRTRDRDEEMEWLLDEIA